MRIRFVLGALLLTSACASSGGGSHVTILDREKKNEAKSGEVVRPTKTPEELKEDLRCKHVWLQHAWHLTEDPTGPGATQICVVSRCPLCGEIRHECTKRRSR